MENYQNSTFEERRVLPEQRLWQAVLGQAMYDLFSEYQNNYVEKGDRFLAECWASSKHQDFVDVCRNAGFDPDYIFKKVQKLIAMKPKNLARFVVMAKSDRKGNTSNVE
jgi:hypothetical protein